MRQLKTLAAFYLVALAIAVIPARPLTTTAYLSPPPSPIVYYTSTPSLLPTRPPTSAPTPAPMPTYNVLLPLVFNSK